MQFFPLASLSNLVIEPLTSLGFIQTAADQIGSELNKDYGVHWYELLIVIGWTFIFLYLSFNLLKRRDF